MGLLQSTFIEVPTPPALFRTVEVVSCGVGQRKAQGGALGHLGLCSAFRRWLLLGITGPRATAITSLSPPALVLQGWSIGTGAERDFPYPLKSSWGPPGTELKLRHQHLKPGPLTARLPPDTHHLDWKKRVMDEGEDRDAPQLPTHPVATT